MLSIQVIKEKYMLKLMKNELKLILYSLIDFEMRRRVFDFFAGCMYWLKEMIEANYGYAGCAFFCSCWTRCRLMGGFNMTVNQNPLKDPNECFSMHSLGLDVETKWIWNLLLTEMIECKNRILTWISYPLNYLLCRALRNSMSLTLIESVQL